MKRAILLAINPIIRNICLHIWMQKASFYNNGKNYKKH